jgi:hypothetical protein
MFVCCVLLNKTTRAQVDKVVTDEFWSMYPSSPVMASAQLPTLKRQIEGTGLGWTKAVRLIRMSHGYYIEHILNSKPLRSLEGELYGLGPYAWDSYRIFCLHDIERIDSNDKELLAYVERRKGG